MCIYTQCQSKAILSKGIQHDKNCSKKWQQRQGKTLICSGGKSPWLEVEQKYPLIHSFRQKAVGIKHVFNVRKI